MIFDQIMQISKKAPLSENPAKNILTSTTS